MKRRMIALFMMVAACAAVPGDGFCCRAGDKSGTADQCNAVSRTGVYGDYSGFRFNGE